MENSGNFPGRYTCSDKKEKPRQSAGLPIALKSNLLLVVDLFVLDIRHFIRCAGSTC